MRTMKCKKFSKILTGLFLLAFLVTSMPQTVLAAGETYTITIDNETAGHTYTAYQIFAGDYKAGTDGATGTLSNIVWGTGITDAGKTALGNGKSAAQYAESLTSTDAEKLADKIIAGGYLATAAGTATAPNGEGSYVIGNLTPGYYLVTDKDTSIAEGEDDGISAYIVQVVGDVEVTPKTGVPTLVKKVKDVNDSTGTQTEWQDSADYDIGDTITFQLTAALPSDGYENFDTYYMAFYDDLSAGLELADPSNFKVYHKASDGKETLITAYELIINTKEDDSTEGAGIDFKLVIRDLNDITDLDVASGDVIIVEYDAELTEGAVIGAAGNPNTAYLDYQRNPNYEGTIIPGEFDEDGKPEDDQADSDKDTIPDSEDEDNDGDGIPDDEDTDDNNDGIPDDSNGDDNPDDTDGDGTPDSDEGDTVIETTEKDKVVVFTYELLIHKIEGVNKEALKGAEFTLYKKGGSGTESAASDTDYKKVTKITGTNTSIFKFSGLDDGDYLLVETGTPAGYNTIDPIKFTIAATHDTSSTAPKLTALTITSDATTFSYADTASKEVTKQDNSTITLTSGQIFTEVVNNAGATLPTTGGIGTTIFYIVGGVCVVVASILLITKRIMNKKQYD